ncbi:unnamed protein product [Cyprideis torosa]|uniref:phosphoglycerate mutase (2,3-diphosphoglycerate-independent) n=1 Tax=Cyprideis torosa TaxID=163714 RepID=A0A7R8WM37_9CRUS|nr:unnamed protein product [Cyprideis torosa]CAG0903199.1 unnamed protein product [Cyprideis torosa]
MKYNKLILMILDGWGIAQDKSRSAIDQANTPFIDDCLKNRPNTQLNTSGNAVGLPEGQMGNSEVGHIHLGAGRVVFQNLEKINQEVAHHRLGENEELQKLFDYCVSNNKALHLSGLVSDGGVHSHINHLLALLDLAEQRKLPKVYVHAITDGRDCDPHSGLGFINQLSEKINALANVELASVIGRYFAMDRDKRWERVKKAYDLQCHAKGTVTEDFAQSIQKAYDQGTTDEFMEPLWNAKLNDDAAKVKDGDAYLLFNFRTDRGRELATVLSQQAMPEYEMKPFDLYFATMTSYDSSFKNVHILFEEDDVKNSLGEVLSNLGKTQLRIAETEKYPHVTFFFSGGREEVFPGEDRIMCPSPRDVATYDEKPEMAAYDIRDEMLKVLKEKDYDFICLNFANTDMVGHTGSMSAAIKACEVVDACAAEICALALEKSYEVLILADHGNADVMVNEDGTPNTQHSTNPVPLIFLSNKKENVSLEPGGLSDLAPTILNQLGLPVPEEMKGHCLIRNKQAVIS